MKEIEPPKFAPKNSTKQLHIEGFSDVQIYEQLKIQFAQITTIADKKQAEWAENAIKQMTRYDAPPAGYTPKRVDADGYDDSDDDDDMGMGYGEDEDDFFDGEGEFDDMFGEGEFGDDMLFGGGAFGEGEFDDEMDDFAEQYNKPTATKKKKQQYDKNNRQFPPSELDDGWFDEEEYQRFVEEGERGEGEGMDLSMLFEDLGALGEGDYENIKYEDFFGPRDDVTGLPPAGLAGDDDDMLDDSDEDAEDSDDPYSVKNYDTSQEKKKKRKFENTSLWANEDEDELNLEVDAYNERQNLDEETVNYAQIDDAADVVDHLFTPYMERQKLLSDQIDALERDIGGPRSFEMRGEVTSHQRQQDSLINEDVEFQQGIKVHTKMGADWSLEIEQIIKQRIKDNVFDDVQIRYDDPTSALDGLGKVKDEENNKVSTAKPRFGLAEQYEREYRALATGVDDANEELQAKYNEISHLFGKVTMALDALSNYHYSAKPKVQEFTVTSTTSVTQREDIGPGGATAGSLSATHGASLLSTTGSAAPQELHQAQHGGALAVAKGEMSKEEKDVAIKRRKEARKNFRSHEEEALQADAKRGVAGAKKKVEQSVLQKEYSKATKSGQVTVHSSVAPRTQGQGSVSAGHKYTSMSGVMDSIAYNDQQQTAAAKKAKRTENQQKLGKYTNSKSVMQ